MKIFTLSLLSNSTGKLTRLIYFKSPNVLNHEKKMILSLHREFIGWCWLDGAAFTTEDEKVYERILALHGLLEISTEGEYLNQLSS